MLPRAQCIIGFAVILGITVAGCSGDSDSDSSGGSAVESVAPAPAAPEASAEFCSFGERFLERGAPLTAAMDANDPALLQAATGETKAQIEGMTRSAPAEIADDLAVVGSLYAEFVAVLEGGNYDLVALSSDPAAQAVVDKLNTPEASAASSTIDGFLSAACGITTES